MLDSGVGGLAVARAFLTRLPGERLVYVGDTAHFPYGTRPAEEVVSWVAAILDELAGAGVKMAVMACNTASAVALPVLRDRYPFPVLGVIEAGARMAVRQTRNGCIGVLATERTVASGAYERSIAALEPRCRVVGRAAPRLVTMVEEGMLERDPEGFDPVLAEHVRPLVKAGADTVILGCTHFLALQGRIARLFPGLAVVNPAAETAEEAAALLQERAALAAPNGLPRHRFLITGQDLAHFADVGARILGFPLGRIERLARPAAHAR